MRCVRWFERCPILRWGSKVLVASFLLAVCQLSLADSAIPEMPDSAAATTQPVVLDDMLEDDGMGGDELLMFADIPMVVTAGRSEQPQNWSSVPVSIITAEDIHYSGLTSIPDLLRFAPGMDVVTLDRWRHAVGIRGMQDFISDRMLTLIDGRAANENWAGGPEFFRYPVLMEDIKRIEIVRGPGGAAWGANAFNGVINIITKEPEDCLGAFGTTTWTHFGDSYSQWRWAAREGKWSWRLSAGYEDIKSSEDALKHAPYDSYSGSAAVDAMIGLGGFQASDFMRNWRFDGTFVRHLAEDAKLKFGSGFSKANMGPFDLMGHLPREEDGQLETSRSFVRIESKPDPDSTRHIQWFTNLARTSMPSYMTHRAMENDLEAQYDFRRGKHKYSVGGNLRWLHLQGSQRPQQVHSPDKVNEYSAGLFMIDHWQLTDRFVLESQLRGDYYSGTSTDWSARMSAMYAMDQAKRHVVRLSGAKAFRTPMVMLREGTFATVPLPSPPFGPGLHLVNLVRNPEDLDNEETASLELGYTGQFTEHLTLRTNAYFQRYDKLIGYNGPLPDPLGARAIYMAQNTDGANAWGGEAELELKGESGKLSAWYAYNNLRLDHGRHIRMPHAPGQHKAGLTGRLFLPHGLVFNANYRFTSAQRVLDPVYDPLPASHRLDLTLSRKFLEDRAEFMIGVSDVLEQSRGPATYIGSMTGHKTPGRTFFVRFQISF